MERVGALISKLQEQFQQKANAAQLMIVTKMLLAELQNNSEQVDNTGNQKVSVVMPVKFGAVEETIVAHTIIEKPAENIGRVQAFKKPEKIYDADDSLSLQAEEVKPEKPANQPWVLNPLIDVPTLAHQNKENIELNQTLNGQGQSLNERLKIEKTELGTTLKHAPVRDLKKAIGVNDRFLFIKELFRGDETMYERSIKTINSFHIYPEAQYWIQRELKLKIGWIEDNPTVAHFDELVKRRFS